MPFTASIRSALFLGAAALAGGAASLLAIAPALAQPGHVVTAPHAPAGARTAKVRYDDLNLASAAGRMRLDGRIRGAVHRVCPTRIGTEPIGRVQEIRLCRETAFETARPQVERAIARAGRGERLAEAGFIEISL